MGSPDFLYGKLIFSQYESSFPRYCKRYVDDILVNFSKPSRVYWFKTQLKRLTIVNFTDGELNQYFFFT